MGDKILIEPRIFHVALDYRNIELYNKLLEDVDETRMKNNEKLKIIRRFHYRYGASDKYTLELYSKSIDTLKPNLNRTVYRETLLTNLVKHMDNLSDMRLVSFFNYLIARPDVDISKPNYDGFPILQNLFTDLWSHDKLATKLPIIRKLLDNGATWNCEQRNTKLNALQHMVKYGTFTSNYDEHITYLITNTDIDVDHKDKDGKTVLELAEERVVQEKKAYEKAVSGPTHWYTPTEANIKKAEEVLELIKARVIGGL